MQWFGHGGSDQKRNLISTCWYAFRSLLGILYTLVDIGGEIRTSMMRFSRQNNESNEVHHRHNRNSFITPTVTIVSTL